MVSKYSMIKHSERHLEICFPNEISRSGFKIIFQQFLRRKISRMVYWGFLDFPRVISDICFLNETSRSEFNIIFQRFSLRKVSGMVERVFLGFSSGHALIDRVSDRSSLTFSRDRCRFQGRSRDT